MVQCVIASPLRERRQRQHAGHEADGSFDLRERKNDPCAQSCMKMNVRTSSPAAGSTSSAATAVDQLSVK